MGNQKQSGKENVRPANTPIRMRPRQTRQGSLFPAALMSTALLLLTACSGEGTALTATQAWILEPSAEGSSIGGLTVHNRTSEARVLQHIMAADFRRASIRTKTNAGADSDPHPPIVVKAGQATELPPDGMVLLLEEPERPLRVGDETLLSLHFDDTQVVFINAEVRTAPPSGHGSAP